MNSFAVAKLPSFEYPNYKCFKYFIIFVFIKIMFMRLSVFIFFFVFTFNVFSQTITTLAPIQTSLCAGGNIMVEYETEGTFNFGCVFTAQLSDAWGNFSNPIDVGSTPFNTGVISGSIPSNTAFGFNYRVRVVSSNPNIIGSVSPLPAIVITSSAVSAAILTFPGTTVCEGTVVSLTANANQTYFWSTGETTQTIQVTTQGTYQVTVTNYITECQVTSNPVDVTVYPNPVVNLGNDTTLCEGDTLQLDAGNGYSQYRWDDFYIGNQFYSVSETGSHYVEVRDSNNCKASDTINIIVNDNPQIDIGNDTIICSTQYFIQAHPNFVSYSWNNGLSLNSYLLITQSGLYHLAVIDSNMCKAYDTISVSIFTPPNVELGTDIAACGNSVILNAGYGYTSYNWNDGVGTQVFYHATQTGYYNVEVTDANGCTDKDTVFVSIYPLPQVYLGSDISVEHGQTVVLETNPNYAHYFWSNGNNYPQLVFNTSDSLPGIYVISVLVIDTTGCFQSDTVIVTVLDNTGVSIEQNYSIQVGPVPFSSSFIMYGLPALSLKKCTFKLTDIAGREIPIRIEETHNNIKVHLAEKFQGVCFLYSMQENRKYFLSKLVAISP